ncbi:MAG: hypothetical protein KDK65_04840, partial [Chlamydiia bacterium]|nr:hypothetical protein [Chlamydiia bacterium]
FSKWGIDEDQQTLLIELKNGQLHFSVCVVDQQQKIHRLSWFSSSTVQYGGDYHLAFTIEIETEKTSEVEHSQDITVVQQQASIPSMPDKKEKEKEKKKNDTTASVHTATNHISLHKTKKMFPIVNFYLNGKKGVLTLNPENQKRVESQSLMLQQSTCALCFGLRYPDLEEASTIQNPIREVKLARFRLWRDLPLKPENLCNNFESDEQSHAIAVWPMDEREGVEVTDVKGKHHGCLSRSDARGAYPPLNTLKVFINTREVRTQSCSFDPLNGEAGYLYLGGSPAAKHVYKGSIGELRVWSCVKTAEELCRMAYTPVKKNETNLAFCAQDLDTVKREEAVDLPVGLDAPELSPYALKTFQEQQNIYRVTRDAASIEVAEVPEMELRGGQTPQSYLQRTYFLQHGETGKLHKGYCVGSLETKHIGQTQTDPSILGFIEGPPPVPGENLTFPYWEDRTQVNAYTDCSQVVLNRSSTQSVTVSNQTHQSTSASFSSSMGVGTDIAAYAGFISNSAKVFSLDASAGVTASLETGSQKTDSQKVAVTNSSLISDRLGIRGKWVDKNRANLDPVEQRIYEHYGRRWKPHNYGYALVSSATAEVWASFLRGTNQMVDLRAIPNPSIPEDRNIIMFKMNDAKVEVGRLDEKIGVIPLNKGPSYYQPEQAYALIKKITEDQRRIEANLVEPNKHAQEVGVIPKVGLVNSYTWTQLGGLHAEEMQFTASLDQVHEGGHHFQVGSGLFADFELSAVGAKTSIGLEFTATHLRQVARSHAKTASSGHAMNIEIKPEGTLEKYDPDKREWQDTIPDGRVVTYRFKAFYLQPEGENYTELRKLVDPEWLHSSDPDATLFRSALRVEKAVWRIFYRVTFIRRKMSRGQSQQIGDDSNPPLPPGAIRDNLLLVSLLHQSKQKPDENRIRKLCEQYKITGDDVEVVIKKIERYLDLLGRSKTYEKKLLIPDRQAAIDQMMK